MTSTQQCIEAIEAVVSRYHTPQDLQPVPANLEYAKPILVSHKQRITNLSDQFGVDRDLVKDIVRAYMRDCSTCLVYYGSVKMDSFIHLTSKIKPEQPARKMKRRGFLCDPRKRSVYMSKPKPRMLKVSGKPLSRMRNITKTYIDEMHQMQFVSGHNNERDEAIWEELQETVMNEELQEQVMNKAEVAKTSSDCDWVLTMGSQALAIVAV